MKYNLNGLGLNIKELHGEWEANKNTKVFEELDYGVESITKYNPM